jgi:transcriptional regulator with XRE-family HTH domain
VTRSLFTRKHERLRQLLVAARKHAKLTQMQLAQRLSRPQSFVSKIERGERRVDVIEFFELAVAMGIDAHAFLKALTYEDGPQEGRPRHENRSRGKAGKPW